MARLSSEWCSGTKLLSLISLLLVSTGGVFAAESAANTSGDLSTPQRIAQGDRTNCPSKAEAIIGESAVQVAWYETENHSVAICRTAEGDPYYHGIPKPNTNQVINDITLPAYRNGRGYSAATEAGTYSINDQELRITQSGETIVQEAVLGPPTTSSASPQTNSTSASETGRRSVTPAPAGWTLSFTADTSNTTETSTDARIAFDLDLQETETTNDRKATLAQGSQFGALRLIQGNGRSLDLDAYQWTIDDQSRLYVGKSGYTYLLALYNYGPTTPTSYQLQMVCQTRAGTEGSAACQLSDNGPLLNGQLVSQGQLNFGPAESRIQRDRVQATTTGTGTIKNIAPETTPDRELERAILAQFSEQEQASQTFRYVYNRTDLNGDGKDEIFAYLENSSFCDGQRCPLLVFETQPSDYRLLTKLPLVAPPVIVNDSKTWGWKDLVLVDEDGSGQSRYQMLRYTGQQYPPLSSAENFNPSRVSGMALLSDREDTPNNGETLPQRDIAPARP